MKRSTHKTVTGDAHPRVHIADGLPHVEAADGPVMVIDTYLPRPGLRGAFLAELAEEIHRTGHNGVGGDSLVYRSLDGEAVVVVTEFRSRAEKRRWRGSEAYCAQSQRLRPLLEHALTRTCEPVAANDAPDSTLMRPDRHAGFARESC
ncbi:MAG TPA: antibiotic biosynthesis monooxygenase [Luteimonas sp.]|nr:antibiotic biosynthesis monooxygenase [Luteimonas sp.]